MTEHNEARLRELAEELFSRLCHECYIVHPAKCDCMEDIMTSFRKVLNQQDTVKP